MKIEVISEGEDVTLGYKKFTFSDGQPHVTLDRAVEGAIVKITVSLTGLEELFDLLLVRDILQRGNNVIHLEIKYLLGARMDRPIDDCQPFTLKVITDLLTGFAHVTILDPHSEVSTELLDADALYPYEKVRKILCEFPPDSTSIVIPDQGAIARVKAVTGGTRFGQYVYCTKKRDLETGILSEPRILNPGHVRKQCLIIDDICDGGRTFVELAEKLREAGAEWVGLFVTHGLFSKGRDLPGINAVYSTDSFLFKGEAEVMISFMQCKTAGGHCWEEDAELRLPVSDQHTCKHCRGTRWATRRVEWSEPRPRQGDSSG